MRHYNSSYYKLSGLQIGLYTFAGCRGRLKSNWLHSQSHFEKCSVNVFCVKAIKTVIHGSETQLKKVCFFYKNSAQTVTCKCGFTLKCWLETDRSSAGQLVSSSTRGCSLTPRQLDSLLLCEKIRKILVTSASSGNDIARSRLARTEP